MSSNSINDTQRRALVPEDVVRIATIDDAQIAPDGATVAYVVKRSILEENRYVSAIYLAPTGASGDAEPRQITTGTSRDTAPRWSPDGQRLAFLSDRTGTTQLYLLDLRGGEAQQITTLERGVSNPVWSPDGTRVAVLSSEGNGIDDEVRSRPGGFIRHISRLQYRFNGLDYIDDRYNDIWIVDVEAARAERLTWSTQSIESIAWSPDATTLAYTTNRLSDASPTFESQLYVVSATPPAEPVTGDTDPSVMVSEGSEIASGPTWSPDGQAIAFIGRRVGARAGANNEIYLATPEGEKLRCLTEGFDRSPGPGSFSDTWSPNDPNPLSWLPDGSGVLFTASDRGRVGVYQAAADGSGVNQVVTGDRTIAMVTLSADGQRMAFVAGSFTNPCDVYTCGIDGANEVRITRINEELLSQTIIQEPELMTFESYDGGFEVDAWLIRPAGFDPDQRYPLVQIIHGGPHSIFGHTFFFDMQQWAGAGWNVLFINPRASQGYGEAFATAAIGDWGGGDWREQEMALDLAIERGGVDPERLAVTGLSYGGFMTNWIIGQTDRYRVAVSENGISNLVSFYTTSDIGPYWLEKEMEREVWSNLAWYMERSPISYVPKMQTPLLLLQAEADWRCPPEQGEQLYAALKVRDVPTEMVRFPGESHTQLSGGKPETRLVRRQVTLDWFKRYL